MPRINAPPAPQAGGLVNELYTVTLFGAAERVDALLSSGFIDIDRNAAEDWTLLRCAASQGHSSVVSVLLAHGANPSKASSDGFTPLHESAHNGRLAVTEVLAKACAVADLNAATKKEGFTPLHLAAERGHWKVMKALIEAGARADSRTPIGESPLYTSALRGHVDAVRVLLRAKANPLATRTEMALGIRMLPLDAAAGAGQLGVVRELIQQCGLEGCAGPSCGRHALHLAALEQRLGVAVFLVEAGVADRGSHALMAAAAAACEPAVKTLLQQHERKFAGGNDAYVNARDENGNTPLIKSILALRFSSRVVRLLVDAGADTESASKIMSANGEVCFDGTPLNLSTIYVYEKTMSDEEGATEKRNRMTAIRRLLQTVEAVHAASWLWRFDAPSVSRALKNTKGITASPVPARRTLPALKRRAGKPRAFSAALFRWVHVWC